jgi:peptide/nickel transport system substrate-binding protein
MNFGKWLRTGTLAVALGLSTLAAQTTVATAETLTIGVRGGPESMDPHYSALGVHADAMKHIFDTLVWSGDNLQIEPGLAESWRPLDDTTWEFKLRKGVKFHDGSDFAAEDVKFSIERIPEVTGPTTLMIYVRRVKEVVIIDPHTVHMKTDGPAATLPNDFVRLFIVSHKAAADYSTKETAPRVSTPERPRSAPARTNTCPGSRRATWCWSGSTTTGAARVPGRRSSARRCRTTPRASRP